MSKRVIDVSHHNGVIDWEQVKSHVDGVIIRCGFGSDGEPLYDDKQFKRNADECTRLAIPFGVYLYSYATNNANAVSEAKHILRMVQGYNLSLPIFYDVEQAGTEMVAKSNAIAFGDVIENAGYFCGVYASLFWWEHYLTGLDRFTKWIAHWGKTCTYKGKFLDVWQYSSKGSIPGISGNVDMNICYREYPKIFNSAPAPAPAQGVAPPAINSIDKNNTIYTVKKGDNLSQIAKKFDTSYQVLAKYNNIKNPNFIKVGQQIKIP